MGPSATVAGRVILLLAALALLAWAAQDQLARPWTVAGPSMEPNLRPGDRVLVDLWTYRQRPPRPGEVVLLRGPGRLPAWWIKRVATPPEVATQPVRPDLWPGSRIDETIWVTGDAGAVSRDSREFGPVPRDRLVGRVALRYWPPSRAGSIAAGASSDPDR